MPPRASRAARAGVPELPMLIYFNLKLKT